MDSLQILNQLIFPFLSVLIGVVSAIVAKSQTRRASDSVRQGIFDHTRAIQHILLEYPRVTLVIYNKEHMLEAEEIADPEFQQRLEICIEMLLDHYEFVVHQSSALPQRDREAYCSFMRDIYWGCEQMQKFLADHKDWYSPTVREHLTTKPALLPQGKG